MESLGFSYADSQTEATRRQSVAYNDPHIPPIARRLHREHVERRRRYAAIAAQEAAQRQPPQLSPPQIVPRNREIIATVGTAPYNRTDKLLCIVVLQPPPFRHTDKIKSISALYVGQPALLIQALTGLHFGVGVLDIRSERRAAKLAIIRHVAMWLCKRFTTLSLVAIGHRFNRDHTTVLHAIWRIEKLGGDSHPDVAAIAAEIIACFMGQGVHGAE